MTSLLSHQANAINGDIVDLQRYQGKPVLIVNTASECGFTPQYKGLEALYQKYKDNDLVILGFPCNQFGKQESGSNSDINEFCEINFGVTFPLMAKIDVNGENAHPLFVSLKKAAPGILGSQGIKWNFTKFLVGRDGKTVTRFGSNKKPEALENAIKAAL